VLPGVAYRREVRDLPLRAPRYLPLWIALPHASKCHRPTRFDRPVIRQSAPANGSQTPLRVDLTLCRRATNDRCLRISLKKPSSIPSDGEACGVSEKGWKGCLGDGCWGASLALHGQHFRKPIDRSQAGEAPEVLSGRRKQEFVLSSVWSSQTQTGQTKDSLEVRE
jgi:hypothetical protein